MKVPRAAAAALAAAAREAASRPARAEPPEKVHAARVASKRLRSYWRALIPVVGKAESRRRRAALSRSARALAAARERDVLRILSRRLAREERVFARPLTAFAGRLRPTPPASIAKGLTLAARELASSARALAAAAREASHSDLQKGVDAIKRKLKTARRDAARRGQIADLHLCRKRAKDLQYLDEAFDVKPHAARRFRQAADLLGDARDLRRLAQRAKLPEGALRERIHELEGEALARL